MRLLMILSLSFFCAAEANAKCFSFRDLDLKVCIDGDDNDARKAAEKVCEDVSKEDCKISGSSGECRASGDKKCYDKDGKEQKHLKAD